MSNIDAVWDKVSRRAPPNRRVLIAGLREFLATCENPHAALLTGRAGPASPDAVSACALESLVIEQYGRRLHSRLDVADWLRLLHDAENELIRNGSTLHTTRLAAFPTPQSSPFHPEAMRASQRVTLWRDAFGKWILSGSSGKTPDEWRAAIALSAVLYGALLDAAKVKGLHAMLDAPLDLNQAAGYSFIEFDMPFQGLGNHHLQRWFLDPLTELLVHRMPANDASQPASKLPAAIRQLLMSNGVDKGKCPSSIADLISSATTWWSCHAAQIDLHAIRRTFCTHSIHPRTAQRLFGYEAGRRRLVDGNRAHTTDGESGRLEDAHVLYAWLAESINLLDAPSLDVAQKNIETLLASKTNNDIARTYVGWLRFMLSGNSTSKSPLTLSTIRKRYVATTERLLAILGGTDPREMESAALEDIYAEIVLEDDPDRPTGALVQGISDFHAYLVRAHGKRHIAKPSQVFGDDAAFMPVDANLISFDDYLAAQFWLDARLADGADPDDTTICKLVMAMAFRLGLRRMEILGLRITDVQVRRGMVCLVRPHSGRRLKTTNSKRIIPIGAFFDWRERRLLKEWVARRQSEETRDNLPAGCVRSQYLFARVNGKSAEERVSVDGVVDRICRALRAVTGDRQIFLHHLRHAFSTWTYLRLRAPDHPMVVDFFTHLPETAKALRQGRRLRLLLRLPRTGSNRAHAHAVARLLGHSSPQVSMGHYVHSSDMILAAITHREIAQVPRAELIAASGLSAATAYRHLETSAHELVVAAKGEPVNQRSASASNPKENGPRECRKGRRANKHAHERPEWLSLEKVWSALHLSSNAGMEPARIAHQLGIGIDRVESILAEARLFGPLIGLNPGDTGLAPCPDKLRYERDKALAQELEARLARMALNSPERYAEGLTLHLEHFNRQKHDVVFRGPKEAKTLQRYLGFLGLLEIDRSRAQWVLRCAGCDAPSLPAWVGKIQARWVPARVKRIAPPSARKASSYSQWVGVQVIDEDGKGLGQAMAVVFFLARIALREKSSSSQTPGTDRLPSSRQTAAPKLGADPSGNGTGTS